MDGIANPKGESERTLLGAIGNLFAPRKAKAQGTSGSGGKNQPAMDEAGHGLWDAASDAAKLGRDVAIYGPAAPTMTPMEGVAQRLGRAASDVVSERAGEDPEAFMERKAQDFRREGFDLAAKALDHYRNGGGRDLWLSDAEAARLPTLAEAREVNRQRFLERTLTGETEGDEARELYANLERLRAGELAENEWHDLGSDFWNVGRKRNKNAIDWLLPGWGDDESAVTLGSHMVTSKARIEARREGDRIRFRIVMNTGLGYEPDEGKFLGESYDFEGYQPGANASRQLEDAGKANVYRIRWQVKDTFEAAEELGMDGQWRRVRNGSHRSKGRQKR